MSLIILNNNNTINVRVVHRTDHYTCHQDTVVSCVALEIVCNTSRTSSTICSAMCIVNSVITRPTYCPFQWWRYVKRKEKV